MPALSPRFRRTLTIPPDTPQFTARQNRRLPDASTRLRCCSRSRASTSATSSACRGTLPFFGVDIWNAYEISWLNLRGKPQVAIATFTVPADSPNIVESKSFKLYLNSFNQTRLARHRRPAGTAARRPVGRLRRAGAGQADHARGFRQLQMGELDGLLLDRLDIEVDSYQPDPALLRADHDEARGRGNAGVAPAQVELPGDRPAGLGQRADPLRRPADRPGRPAADT